MPSQAEASVHIVAGQSAGAGGDPTPAPMSHFLGTHTNRIDAKGRVSIPAGFRAALRGLAPEGVVPLVLRVSHSHPCIEGWPAGAFDELAAPLRQMNVFGEDHDDLASVLYADAYPVETDKEGRIVLAEPLLQHAGITDAITFMGLGRTFQVWEPAAAERRRTEARARARILKLTLPGAAQPHVAAQVPA